MLAVKGPAAMKEELLCYFKQGIIGRLSLHTTALYSRQPSSTHIEIVLWGLETHYQLVITCATDLLVERDHQLETRFQ